MCLKIRRQYLLPVSCKLDKNTGYQCQNQNKVITAVAIRLPDDILLAFLVADLASWKKLCSIYTM